MVSPLATGFPPHSVADGNRASLDDFGKCPTSPVVTHGCLEACGGLLHQFARPSFAANTQAARADDKHAASALFEVDARQDDVRAPRFGAERRSDFRISSFHRSCDNSVTWRRPPTSALPARPRPRSSTASA